MPTGPKKLPTLRNPRSPEELEVFQREVREILRRLWEEFNELPTTEATTYDVFTDTVDGLVPAPGTPTGGFLKDDGTWSAPSGAVTDVSAGSTAVVVSPTTGSVVVDVDESQFSGVPMSGITFSGTNNRLSKFSGATLADSTITDTGALVTIASPTTITGAGILNSTLNVQGAADLDSTLNVDGAATLQSTLTLPLMTPGSVLFAGTGGLVSRDNANLFYDDTNNRLGVGTTAPSVALHNVGVTAMTGASAGLFVGTTPRTQNDPVLGFLETNVEFTQDATNTVIASSYGTGVNAAFQVFRGRGTATATTALQTNDVLGSFGFTGATSATAHHSGAYINAVATENWVTGTNVGTKLEFYTSKNATPAASGRAVRLTLDHDGTATFTGQIVCTNTTSPIALFGTATSTKSGNVGTVEITKDSANTVLILSTYGTGVNPSLYMFRGRGTAAATTAVQSGDGLGTFTFGGSVGGTGLGSSAFISAFATENWGGGILGSKLTFTTCLNGSTTRLQKLAIENDGALTLTNSATAAVSGANELKLRYNTTGHVLQISANGGAYTTIGAGTGTVNKIPKWSSTTGGLTDSSLSDDGTTLSTALATTLGNARFTVKAADPTANSVNLSSAAGTIIADLTAFALGTGGALTFTGKYSSAGTLEDFATIRAMKANATDGDKQADLVIGVNNTSAVSERMRIGANGTSVTGSLSATAGVSGSASGGANGVTGSHIGTASVADRQAGSFGLTTTFNATAADRFGYGVKSSATGSRSSGAFNVTNYALWGDASGGQVNYALYTDRGDVTLNATSGTFTAGGSRFSVTSANPTANAFTSTNGTSITDLTAFAQGVGGQINFFGKTDAVPTISHLAMIRAYKTNGTSASTTAAIVFGTNNGTSVVERLRIDSSNVLSVASALGTVQAAVCTLSASGGSGTLSATYTGTGITVDRNVVAVRNLVGTFDTTAGALTSYGVNSIVTSTRSAGANSLTNIALYGTASGAQTNYALYTNDGDVKLNATSGVTTIVGAATCSSTLNVTGATTLDGNVALGNAAGDTIAAHGAAGSTQQTVTALTDNSAGTANNTVEALTDGVIYANDVAAIRNNFADLAAKINEFRTVLRNIGFLA